MLFPSSFLEAVNISDFSGLNDTPLFVRKLDSFYSSSMISLLGFEFLSNEMVLFLLELRGEEKLGRLIFL